MTTTNDQLAVLRRLRADGQISEEEFEDLAGGLSSEPYDEPYDEAPDEDAAEGTFFADDAVGEDDDTSAPEDGAGPAAPFLMPSFRPNLSVNYLGGLLLASLVLLVAALLGVLSWWVSIPAMLVLLSTLLEGWGKVTLVGGALVAVILLIDLALPSGGGTVEPNSSANVTVPPADPYPPIPGSLGIYMDQITELWNEVEAQPRINRGLTRQNEIGEYDAFIYRFDEWGRVAGAYDPANDAVYALLVTGVFSAPATDELYIHLCFMVAPFSQECIDSYREEGLDGATLEELTDVSHTAEWTVGDSVWRLEIDQNVLTIRVYGPDAA